MNIMIKAKVDLANSKYIGFTEERLVRRYNILSQIVTDEDALDIEIAEAALDRREVKELLQMFRHCHELGLDTEGMTACDILEATTGERIEILQRSSHNAGNLMVREGMKKGGEALRTTTQVTKKGLNVFGKWLAKATEVPK